MPSKLIEPTAELNLLGRTDLLGRLRVASEMHAMQLQLFLSFIPSDQRRMYVPLVEAQIESFNAALGFRRPMELTDTDIDRVRVVVKKVATYREEEDRQRRLMDRRAKQHVIRKEKESEKEKKQQLAREERAQDRAQELAFRRRMDEKLKELRTSNRVPVPMRPLLDRHEAMVRLRMFLLASPLAEFTTGELWDGIDGRMTTEDWKSIRDELLDEEFMRMRRTDRGMTLKFRLIVHNDTEEQPQQEVL